MKQLLTILVSLVLVYGPFVQPVAASWLMVLSGSVPAGSSPGTTSLLAYYALEDANDSHSGAKNLSVGAGAPTYTAGKVNNAMLIDAAEWLTRADEAAFEPGSTAWSVSLWFNATDATPTGAQGIATKWLTTGNQRTWRISQEVAGTTQFFVSTDGTANVSVATTDTRSDATWYHCVVVYVPSTSIKIYINGSLNNTNTTSIPASLFGGTAAFEIGTYTGSGNSFRGQIDECSLYTKELTAANVTWLYNAGSGRTYADL